jgi:hypothetical protein
MYKYILADMITEKLTREIGMVTKPLPDEIKIIEKVLPSGRVRFECALYQAEKLKKISINNHTHGESGAGTVIVIVADDEYDLPYMLVDIAFDLVEKGKIFTEFEAMPLIKDEESTRKYVEPFRKLYETIDKLPSEPVTGFGESGEFLRSNLAPTQYLRLIHDGYTNEILKYADQFFDIFLDIYRKAEPVKDAERRSKMDAFRTEWNKHILADDASGQILIEALGRQKAELFYDYFTYL